MTTLAGHFIFEAWRVYQIDTRNSHLFAQPPHLCLLVVWSLRDFQIVVRRLILLANCLDTGVEGQKLLAASPPNTPSQILCENLR